MLRVAMDVTPLIGPRTGVGVFTAGALSALAARPDLAMSGYAVTFRGTRVLPKVLPSGVSIGRTPLAARPLRALWRRFDGPSIEWWTGRVDVVHGTNYLVPPARHAAEVVSVHDLSFVRYPDLCEPATLVFPDLIRRALKRGAMVHVLSSAIGAEVVELLGASPDRVRVIHLGVDRDSLAPTGSVPGTGRPYILALGTVEPRKDVPSLVRAFDQVAVSHPDLELVIAGPVGWGEEALTEAVARAAHRSRIRRLGRVGDVERASLLRGSVLLAYPSVYEGFGLPVLEAMTIGAPVVATATGGIPEVAGGAARLVPVGDADALAAALSLVIDDEAERARLIAAGRHRAAEFTWTRCATGLRNLYAEASTGR